MARIMLRDFFYAMIILSIAAGCVTYIFTLLMTGGNNPDAKVKDFGVDEQDIADFNRSFNRIDVISKDLGSLEENLTAIKPEEENVFSIGGALMSSTWTVVISVIGSIGLMDSVFEGVANTLQIPLWIPAMISLFIVAMFVFCMITLIFRREA